MRPNVKLMYYYKLCEKTKRLKNCPGLMGKLGISCICIGDLTLSRDRRAERLLYEIKNASLCNSYI